VRGTIPHSNLRLHVEHVRSLTLVVVCLLGCCAHDAAIRFSLSPVNATSESRSCMHETLLCDWHAEYSCAAHGVYRVIEEKRDMEDGYWKATLSSGYAG
jgi:hypothetical protein